MHLYYTFLYYTVLYYTVLYYTILYYTILYYTILYYDIVWYNRIWCDMIWFDMIPVYYNNNNHIMLLNMIMIMMWMVPYHIIARDIVTCRQYTQKWLMFHCDVGLPEGTVIGDKLNSRNHPQVLGDPNRDVLHMSWSTCPELGICGLKLQSFPYLEDGPRLIGVITPVTHL